MPSTFINLTNELLRKFNEVEITNPSQFNSLRGVQAVARDAIRNAIRDINQLHYEWPFNAYEHTQTLVKGISEYSWPDNFKYAEWESFFIVKDDTLGTDTRDLKRINREEWYSYFRDMDLDSLPDGRSIPEFVFPSHGTGFGVTPVPNQNYQIKYRYFRDPPDLVEPDDEVIIPSQWDNVIIMMATPQMYIFRNNPENAQLSEQKAMELLGRMRGILTNKEFKMFDRRINLHNRAFKNGYINVG